jgi:hypothetical protein
MSFVRTERVPVTGHLAHVFSVSAPAKIHQSGIGGIAVDVQNFVPGSWPCSESLKN